MSPVSSSAHAAFLPTPLLAALHAAAEPVPGVPGLRVAPGLQAAFPELEAPAVLALVVQVARSTAAAWRQLLAQRQADRAFIDAEVQAAVAAGDTDRVMGRRDAAGRVVVGPLPAPTQPHSVEVPPFLRGDQVTLFGPPDSARLSINAMNALHRRRPDEPALVSELVAAGGQVPRWGADSEDSKTPLARDLLQASRNLAACFDGSLQVEDPATGRRYALAETGRSLPIKRIAGLALPDGNHLLDGEPLPLHTVELVQHLWLHRDRPQARVLYLPKLENEEEAAYVAVLLRAAEGLIGALHPALLPGSTRVLVVFENPRAIFRIPHIAQALHPWFLGGSLGWHDFLASTARLFRRDPAYRIPVKADPDIVIHHIRESHGILVDALTPLGALRIGGMYGVLFLEDEPGSFQVSMVGYIRDVLTQLRRGLDGFWVAHPDFVRIGLALVEAFRRGQRALQDDSLRRLVQALVPDPAERVPLLAFLDAPDAPRLSQQDPRYLRAVLAAELPASGRIANDDPEELRYNVFQALQYLADWLSGHGCVALPTRLRTAGGKAVFVRVMDDLATTERSRWELWAEVHHGRVPATSFQAILDEELRFLEDGRDGAERRIAVHWTGQAARWYPVAGRLLRQLVLDPEPPEFVTELLLPFTFAPLREAVDPWAAALALCPGKYERPASGNSGPG